MKKRMKRTRRRVGVRTGRVLPTPATLHTPGIWRRNGNRSPTAGDPGQDQTPRCACQTGADPPIGIKPGKVLQQEWEPVGMEQGAGGGGRDEGMGGKLVTRGIRPPANKLAGQDDEVGGR